MTRLLTAAALLLALSGPALAEDAAVPKEVQAVLLEAETLELYALDPEPKKGNPNTLEPYAVKAKVKVAKGEDREALVEALNKGLVPDGPVAGCFNPRHGIKASHEGKTVTLVICFECAHMYIHVNDKDEMYPITGHARTLLDRLLSPPAKED